MSILNWVRRCTLRKKTPNSPTLPDPQKLKTSKKLRLQQCVMLGWKMLLSSEKKTTVSEGHKLQRQGQKWTVLSSKSVILSHLGTSVRNCLRVVNVQNVMAGAKRILMFKDSTLLKENGGTIDITKEWAPSLLNRMGFSKRKGTKEIKHFTEDYEDIKGAFVKTISDNVTKCKIPNEVVINWDQTAINLIPCGEWTMHESEKSLNIIELSKKKNLTLILL